MGGLIWSCILCCFCRCAALPSPVPGGVPHSCPSSPPRRARRWPVSPLRLAPHGPSGDPFGFTANPPPGVAAPEARSAESLRPRPRRECPAAALRPDLIAQCRAASPLAAGRDLQAERGPGGAARRRREGQGQRPERQRARRLAASVPVLDLAVHGRPAAIWSNLGKGQLVSTGAAAGRLHLAAGQSYPVSAAVLTRVPFGGTIALSVTGADAIVNLTRSAQLGLARNFAVLISAPRARACPRCWPGSSRLSGRAANVVNLVSYALVTASRDR